jgi:4-hydroxy-3-polyprenylbenzoate decarboxylase
MRIILGITGASGVIYGIRLLEELAMIDVETHVVVSPWGQKTIAIETDEDYDHLRGLANHCYDYQDMNAPIASGSFKTDGMVVVPCSMKTLASIRIGLADNLITRAADVTLKERRRLLLVARETPFSGIHLENMLALSHEGALIMPPIPSFYSKPGTINDMVDQFIGRILDQFGIENRLVRRWNS